MTATDPDAWYEIRHGQYFCKKDNRPLIGQTMKEAFVLDAPSESTFYSCEVCGRNVFLSPSPR